LNKHLWSGEQRQEQQEQAAVRKQVQVMCIKHYVMVFRQKVSVKHNSTLLGFSVGPKLIKRIDKMHQAVEVEPVRPSLAR
jgi:hypothetical protein